MDASANVLVSQYICCMPIVYNQEFIISGNCYVTTALVVGLSWHRPGGCLSVVGRPGSAAISVRQNSHNHIRDHICLDASFIVEGQRKM